MSLKMFLKTKFLKWLNVVLNIKGWMAFSHLKMTLLKATNYYRNLNDPTAQNMPSTVPGH